MQESQQPWAVVLRVLAELTHYSRQCSSVEVPARASASASVPFCVDVCHATFASVSAILVTCFANLKLSTASLAKLDIGAQFETAVNSCLLSLTSPLHRDLSIHGCLLDFAGEGNG
jgi:hypothetical protein